MHIKFAEYNGHHGDLKGKMRQTSPQHPEDSAKHY